MNKSMHVEFDLRVSSLWFPCIVVDACCNVSHETYLQLNAMRSTWLQVAVPRADGNSLHNYYPPCIDCLVLYIVIVFVGLICLWFLFLTLDQKYVDAAMLYPLFHCIYTLQFWLIRQVWFIFVNGYIHVKFIIKLDFLAVWLCLTYCCCGYCRCCDEFISSSQPDLIDFILHIILEILYRAERLRSI
jgi:hypothetical protein